MPFIDPHAEFAVRDVSDDCVGRDEELAAVIRCIELRVDLWRSLLAYVPAVAAICALARRVLPRELCPDAVLQHLAAAAAALEERDDDAARAAYVAARRVAAEKLGPADPDMLLCDSILADLTSLELGERVGLARDIELPAEASACFIFHVSTMHMHRQALNAAREAVVAGDDRVLAFALAMPSGGPPLSELIEAGSLGLRLAIGRFVPRRGVRFSTCAKWWIRRSLRIASIEFNWNAAAPTPPLLAIWQIRHTVREFMALHGRGPIDEELVGLTGLPLARIRQARGPETVGERRDRA